jgi:hypothetical protein
MKFVLGCIIGIAASVAVTVADIDFTSNALGDRIAENITNMRNGVSSQSDRPLDVYASSPGYGEMAPSRTWTQHLSILGGSVPSGCLVGKRYLQGVESELLLGNLTESQNEVSQNILNICN